MRRGIFPNRPCGRFCVIGGIVLFVLAFGMALVALAPMQQAVRLLPSFTNDRLMGTDTRGPWHDGRLRLVCRLPAGGHLDCGVFDLRVGRASDGSSGFGAQAIQPDGGKLAGNWALSGWQVQVRQFRVPMSTLAMLFPLAGQMQLGGVAWIDGRFESPGRGGLDVRWQGVLGEFPIGEQRLRAEVTAGQVDLRFVPGSAEPPQPMRVEGGVRCAQGAAIGSARCEGRIDISLSDADPRLEAMIAATSRRIAPGRYQMVVDAR